MKACGGFHMWGAKPNCLLVLHFTDKHPNFNMFSINSFSSFCNKVETHLL